MAALVAEVRTEVGREGLRALLRDPSRALVGLDFDGTLSPIVDEPQDARAHPGAVPALQALGAHLGQLAIVTGRPVDSVIAYAGLAGVAGLEHLAVLGHYGLERWDAAAGEVSRPDLPDGVEQVRRALPGLLAGVAPDAGIEDKGAALAVHTRRSATPQASFEALRGPLLELARSSGLVLEPGRLVLELRPAGMDKGAALRSLVDTVRSAGAGVSATVFVGDDLGDLAAFDAVAALRQEGTPGLLVCSGSDEVPELLDRADIVVDGPPGVVSWLEHLAGALAELHAPDSGFPRP